MHHRYLHRKGKVRYVICTFWHAHLALCVQTSEAKVTRESAWSQEAILAAAMEAPEHQQDIVHWLMDEAQKVVSAKVRARVASLASAPVYASVVCQQGAGARSQAHLPGAIRKGCMPAL